MSYLINHIHIRSEDPHASAEWYKAHFGATIISEKTVIPGTVTISMDTGGPVKLNISSHIRGASDQIQEAELNRLGLEHYKMAHHTRGASDQAPEAELNRVGLEHFGFATSDISSDITKFETGGVRIVLPVTEIPGGVKIAYIEGPDKVLIELVESPTKLS